VQTLVSQELADNVSVTSENQPDHELSSLLTCSAEDGMVGAAAASLVALEHIIDEDTDTDTESIQSHESNDNHSDMPNLASLVHLRHRLVKMSRRLSIAPNAGPSLHTRSDDHTLPNISEQDSETPDSGSFNEQLFTPPGRSVDAFSPVSKIGSPFARLAHHVRRASFASHKPDLTSVVAMAQQHETERLPVLGRRPSMALLRVAVDSNIADSPAMSRAGSVTADHSTPAKANPHAELTSLLSASSLALQHRLARFEALIEALPPPGSPGRSFRINWVWHVLQNHGVCTVDFAAQVNRAVHLIDIRTEEEVCGPSGHIAGSSWFPLSDLHTLPSLLPSSNCPVVIIAQFEDDARLACAELERLGLTYIAPMQGGIVAWRLYGFSCARDSTLLSQRGKLRPRPLLEDMEVVNTVTSHHPRRHSVDHSHRRRPSIYSPTAAASTAHNESIDFELVRQTSQSQDAVTLADIKRHVGDPNSLRWLKLSAFTLHESMSCVDGRNDDAVVGTVRVKLESHFFLLLQHFEFVLLILSLAATLVSWHWFFRLPKICAEFN
jgi:rhodanese-related sulfurtransferase